MTTRAAVEAYFDQIVWSLEKQEYKKLTEKEKRRFIDRIDAAKGRPPKGP